MIEDLKHNAPLGHSDHEILDFKLVQHCSKETHSKQLTYNYFKGNYSEINRATLD